MLGPSVKRLAATRPLEKAGMVLALAAMVVSAAAALLLLACPASPRRSTAVGSALSAPKKLRGCGASVAPGAVARECDLFDGEWVRDDSYPLYESKDCPFLDGGFRCSENGRPDTSYTRWRWQPSCCNLPRFDAKSMLERLRNKRVRWIEGFRICELAPDIYERIPKRIRSTRLVSDALENGAWAGDIGPDLSAAALDQFLSLWPRIEATQLAEGVEDSIVWAWEKDGRFSARSAYAARFMGLEVSPMASFTWKSRAPLQCRFFTWLAVQDRCWTSDRLARRGLPHQDACPLCDQHEESIQHLLISCVFARQVWHGLGVITGRREFEPLHDETLGEWCIRQDQEPRHRRSTRAKCLLGMWMVWKHRNDIVFNGATTSLTKTMERIREEGRLWAKAGLFKGEIKGFEELGSVWVSQE